MKKLWIYILLLFSLVEIWSFGSCSGQQNYDGRLTAADSLMMPYPDSALAIVQPDDFLRDIIVIRYLSLL